MFKNLKKLLFGTQDKNAILKRNNKIGSKIIATANPIQIKYCKKMPLLFDHISFYT